MTQPIPATCPHELRPGLKVCLHCRRAEREAKESRQRAILMRLGITGAALGLVVYAGLVGYRTWKGQGSPTLSALLASPAALEAAPVRTATAQAPAVDSATMLAPAAVGTQAGADSANPHDSASAVVAAPAPGAAPLTANAGSLLTAPVPAMSESLAAPAGSATTSGAPAQSSPVPSAPVTPPAAITPPAAPLLPVVAEGRTELQNGMYALRRGDTVTVHFDTPEARTRRPEKFEQIVRATLPAVHGAAAASMLAGIASGALVAPGETITEPQGGIALRTNDGRTLSVVPQTRPGRDGPLVVGYRVTPSR